MSGENREAMLERKLRSRSGASLVFALVVFSIASVLSLSMLSSALTAVRSAAVQRSSEQAYLSDLAASRLLQTVLDRPKVEKREYLYWEDAPSGKHAGGVVEYTHDALSEAEKAVMDRLCLFVQGKTAAALSITPPEEHMNDVSVEWEHVDGDEDDFIAVLCAQANGETIYTMHVRFRCYAETTLQQELFSYTTTDGQGKTVTVESPRDSYYRTIYSWEAESVIWGF